MEFHRKLDLLFSHTTQHPAMEALFCNCPIALGSSPSSKTRKIHQSFPSKLFSHPQTSTQKENPSWTQNLLFPALAGSLSLTLLVSSPSFAVESSPPFPLQSPSSGYCQEAAEVNEKDIPPESVTNEGIVEEAWDVVSETFLDAGRNRWSPDKWQQMREDILGRTIKSRSKAHDVIRKMLATLEDPYTRFLSPAEFSKMARYDVTGIGINLREIPGEDGAIKLKVLGVILDGPAHSAGIRQGDEILAVNGVNVKGKSAFDVSSLIQGPKETFVTVEVKHGNCGPAQSFNVQRQVIARTPVFYRLEPLENGTASVGYIRLKEFNALARKDLVIAMKQLQDSGASYFILDLRDNLGGLVQAGIEVAKLFLNEGETIIYTVGRDPQFQNTIIAENAPMVTAPVIVLVNNRTASASEIVATALHDNCRAALVGEQTYGKGLIQSVFELHDGSGVVVTVGKYVTPNHMDINGNGIEPDFPRMPAWSEVQKHLSQCRRKG